VKTEEKTAERMAETTAETTAEMRERRTREPPGTTTCDEGSACVPTMRLLAASR
jgi:hypothetical protein